MVVTNRVDGDVSKRLRHHNSLKATRNFCVLQVNITIVLILVKFAILVLSITRALATILVLLLFVFITFASVFHILITAVCVAFGANTPSRSC